ncbi:MULTISPECIES: hypothetical protein [Pseudanabaena]|jgi:hypothetical protein|uniref:hypothetical protein n=1 Tax=Pseudanabaena TaxID=1152 RepID=UPI0024791CFA|nr:MULTISPECIES: hypothetical protein [Pseudanabaena]MEA5485698.1 hypothetical protein [Pseudanabaena sp. CCNP1317]WGS72043.1 hypothetical protein OA858_20410 [Pseudanabaena galeata CCNP1313]
MDEASIVNAIEADLQNYKVKTQIRRKESQLHVLITRADGDDVDYASLYDIVKRRIDKLPIEGADSLVVYGRISGAKHPEWHKTAEIKPPLPLIELDLEELEEFGDIGAIENLPFNSDETEIQTANLESPIQDDLKSFKSSIENDLKIAANKAVQDVHAPDEINNTKNEDFDLGNLDLQTLNLDSLPQNTFELVSFDKDPFEVNGQESERRSPSEQKESWSDHDEDFNFDSPTVAAIPMPLPPPPPTVRRTAKKPIPTVETEHEPIKTAYPRDKSLIFSVAFGAVAIAIVGICGWLVWDRSNQQQYLANSRNFSNQDINPKKITKLETLTGTRNRLQTIISQLEGISDRPASLYGDAQSELATLRPKLAEFDRKINIEQTANKNLESAKNGTIEAAKLTQNPPHRSTVWKSAQEKRQQAIKQLEEIPTDSVLYGDAQQRIKAYRPELVQISKWVEIQQRAETVASTVNSATVNQLNQLKSKDPEKQKFLPQCQNILQPKISNTESQRTGIPIPALTSYLCAYFWDS